MTSLPDDRLAAWKQRTLSLAGGVLGPFLGLLVVFATFSTIDEYRYQSERSRYESAEGAEKARLPNPRRYFATKGSLQKISKDASLVGVAALGMTLIIIAGGIDLSAGTATALCATVTAWVMRESPLESAALNVTLAILAGFATGCLCGLLNGSLISLLGVVPFIVTLGTMTAFNGAGLILANNTPIRAHEQTPAWIPALQLPYPSPPYLFKRELLPIPHLLGTEWGRVPLIVPTGVWLMLLLAVLVWLLLRFTVFGRHVFAVGANEEAARLCGISVVRVRIAVYSLAGLFVGVAGLYQFALLEGEGDPNAGSGKELDFIAAVVIGGGSLAGGRGSVVGTLVGAFIMATIRHGCVTVGVSTAWQMVVLGVIIVGAVTLDQYRQRGRS